VRSDRPSLFLGKLNQVPSSRPLARTWSLSLWGIFFFLLLGAFTSGAAADFRSDYVLATLRQVRNLLLEEHVDAPSEARLSAGALTGVREIRPLQISASGGWPALEEALQTLQAREPQALGAAAERAILRMVEAVADPYTALLNRQDMMVDRQAREQGAFTGIGVELAWDSTLVVVACLEGSPARAAGVLSGDRIVAVDGRAVQGLSFYRAGNLLTGPEGSSVLLEIERRGHFLKIPVTRRHFRIPGVQARILAPGVGLVRLGYFGPEAGGQTRKALEALAARGARCLVLDLRMNPGGDFQQGLQVAGLFRGGELLRVQTRAGTRKVLARAEPVWRAPVAVLVDQGTASSGEIVAQALKGTPGIRIFGRRTFGKAVIQTLHPLPGGYGVRITTGRYRGRDGASLDQVGLQPDQVVPAGAEAMDRALAWLTSLR
jgi:carboxyl-terminal processing protease